MRKLGGSAGRFYLQPAMCLSRGKEEIFLKPMHKNTNLSAFVKGKTSVLRPPLTNASKFV